MRRQFCYTIAPKRDIRRENANLSQNICRDNRRSRVPFLPVGFKYLRFTQVDQPLDCIFLNGGKFVVTVDAIKRIEEVYA